jgi:hypothetical protein
MIIKEGADIFFIEALGGFLIFLKDEIMALPKIATQIWDSKTEIKGNVRVKAHAFTNEYKVYDDIGASTRLEVKERRPISKKIWWKNLDGHNSVRAFYVLNDDLGQSVVCHEEHAYQFDNYVSVRAPRFGVQIGGELGEIQEWVQNDFKIDSIKLDLGYLMGAIMGKEHIQLPVQVKFIKNKIKQYDGIIAFHAASRFGQEFRLITKWNVKNQLVIPVSFKDSFNYYLKW